MDYTKAITAIEKHLASGQSMTREIEVDGQRLVFHSLTEIMTFLDRLKADQAAATPSEPYAKWRIQISNPGDGGV